MSELILHHYANSPFSEKVRLVLGMKRLAWRSVWVPSVLPKPDVVALTGGYRRTPFLQIGADVYCDSALMCRVIDRLAPEPPLYPRESAGLADIVAQWADAALFWAAIPYTMQPAGAQHVFAGTPPEAVKVFAADRAAMTGSMRRSTTRDAGAHLGAYLARIAAMLADGRTFLLGEEPSIADFSVAQSIWFVRRAPPIAASTVERYPGIAAWYGRVGEFGQGEPTRMTSAEAIGACAAARELAACEVAPGQGFEAHDEVVLVATDYAHDEVRGRLVGLDDDSVVLARTDDRAGRVQVHFPRIGYQLRADAPKKENT